jgi:hypothetical protein
MKLSGPDLDHLRRGLRTHPRIAQHVAALDLEQMRTKELVALASRFDLDARGLIDTVRQQDQERMAYSTRFPAFRGTLNFDLTVELLGKRVTRKAMADYTFTPQWEYWDLRKRAPYVGWPGSGLCVTVRTVPDKDLTCDGRPSWEKIDILDISEAWDVLDDAIEERCRAEDAKRRRAAERKRRSRNGGLTGGWPPTPGCHHQSEFASKANILGASVAAGQPRPCARV